MKFMEAALYVQSITGWVGDGKGNGHSIQCYGRQYARQ